MNVIAAVYQSCPPDIWMLLTPHYIATRHTKDQCASPYSETVSCHAPESIAGESRVKTHIEVGHVRLILAFRTEEICAAAECYDDY